VRARLAADVLTVEVSDRGDDRPHRRVPTEEGGIGLNLVYFLADRVEIDRDRSRVRCEFDAAATSPRPSIAGTHGEPYGVDLAREGTALRIALRGDVDLTARAELEWLFAEVERARPEHVVIDLGEVTFVDSTGLRMAYRFDRWGRDNGAAVVFTRASPEVMRAFETAGLALRLMFSDTP
jgi:anti-anti-sigma factor